jgi:hypothetical protein
MTRMITASHEHQGDANRNVLLKCELITQVIL